MSRTKSPVVPVEHEPLSGEERVAVWLKANRIPVLVGTGILALVVLVTWGVTVAGARKEAAARAQLEQAWNAQDAGNLPLASSEFQRVTQAFDGTNAALEARLSLNQARLLNGQSQLAVDDLRDFLIKSLPPRFAAAANLLLGAALENLGQSKEAGVAYLAAAETSEQDFIKAEALLDASRALVAAGDREAAISSLRTIIESYPETASGPIAEVRLGELTRGS